MRRVAISLAAVAVLLGWITPVVQAEITAEEVRTALANGIHYLKSRQKANGTWTEYPGYEGGITSLCTLALLHAGAGPDDPNVRRALDWLREHKFEKTYAVSLQTMVFCKATPADDALRIQQNVEWLEENQIPRGPDRGSWAYPGGFKGDNSNSQFAILALAEAERTGARVREQTWRWAKAYWMSCQNSDGSWGYRKNPRGGSTAGTGSMTCAGIASMIIVNDATSPPDATVAGDVIRCCGREPDKDDPVDRGLAWLARNFSVARNPAQLGGLWSLYYLYGVERVGRMTAERFIGRHDWYREGADLLIRWYGENARRPGGRIVVPDYWVGRGHAEDNELVATSWALLFLSKGRWPVLLAKARHRPADDWNQHRHDVANLARYVESQWKFDMTWQVVDVDLASVDDLAQSPVIYYSGSQNPLPADETERKRLAAKLRGYLDRGGFLLAEPDCGGKEFDEGFRELMRRVFPEPEYRLQLLDAAHPIWHAEETVDVRHVRPLLGIDFGCRTSVVYAPLDPPNEPRPSLSCLWELSRPPRGVAHSESVQAKVKAARSLGINILAYATGRELRSKDEVPTVTMSADQDPLARRGSLAVAVVRHPGGCNAAPRAVVHLLERAASELKLRTLPEERLVNLTDESLFDYPLVMMHGRSKFSLTEAERKQLRLYVERGGMVLADSICASTAFTESFRREMAAVFPGKTLAKLAADDPLLAPGYGGYDLKTVTRNDPSAGDEKGPIRTTKRRVPPVLEGIKFEDRWGVVFSPYDISCALERHGSLECQGYTQEDATRIALNVVLYALQQ